MLIAIVLLSACNSKYSSIKQVRNSTPLKDVVVTVPLDEAYENIVTAANECFGIELYRIHSLKRTENSEVAVLAQNFTGPQIWLSVILNAIDDDKTKLSLYWGNSNWDKHADNLVQWARGVPPDC